MSSNLAKAIQFAGCEAAAAGEAEPACYRTLRASIAKKTAAVAVCGMGYVGLPLCRAITEQGFPVILITITSTTGCWWIGRGSIGGTACRTH